MSNNKKENAHKLAILAAAIYSKEWRKSKLSKNDFWEIQCGYNKMACKIILREILNAPILEKEEVKIF